VLAGHGQDEIGGGDDLTATASGVAARPLPRTPADDTVTDAPSERRRRRNRTSAIGERQMLPVQTKRISMTAV
jgi:hypothetical protein